MCSQIMNVRKNRLREGVKASLLGLCFLLLAGCEALRPMLSSDDSENNAQVDVAPAPQSELDQRQAKASLAYSKARNIESTLFIDNMKASISLKATVNALAPPGGVSNNDILLKEGYTFQFRSINKKAVSVGNVIIQTDRDMVVVEAGNAEIPSGKGYTMLLDLSSSRRVNPNKNATLMFDYQGRSISVILREHQLVDIFETAMR